MILLGCGFRFLLLLLLLISLLILLLKCSSNLIFVGSALCADFEPQARLYNGLARIFHAPHEMPAVRSADL